MWCIVFLSYRYERHHSAGQFFCFSCFRPVPKFIKGWSRVRSGSCAFFPNQGNAHWKKASNVLSYRFNDDDDAQPLMEHLPSEVEGFGAFTQDMDCFISEDLGIQAGNMDFPHPNDKMDVSCLSPLVNDITNTIQVLLNQCSKEVKLQFQPWFNFISLHDLSEFGVWQGSDTSEKQAAVYQPRPRKRTARRVDGHKEVPDEVRLN